MAAGFISRRSPFALMVVLVGCTPHGTATVSALARASDSWTEEAGSPLLQAVAEVVPVTVTPAAHTNVYTVAWDTPDPADSVLVFGEGDAFDHSVAGTSADGLHHEATLVGLAGGSTWQVQVASTGDGVYFTSDPIPLTPEAAPADLPALTVSTPASDDVSGLTLTVVLSYPDVLVALLDREGRYVWWQDVHNVGTLRALYDPTTQSVSYVSGNGTPDNALWRCPLDGVPEEVAALPATHHDVKLDPAGGWYVLAYDEREVEIDDGNSGNGNGDGNGDGNGNDDDENTVVGDRILHVSADGAEVTTVWSSWDEFPYEGLSMSGSEGTEYPHTNSFDVDPDTGNLLISLYLADTLAFVDPTTGLSEWTMGGTHSNWTLPSGTGFARQHSPHLFDDGAHLALFDNGSGSPDDAYAQAAIYDLDWDTRTATRSWMYDEGGVHSHVTMGSVSPVAGGSALVSWGSEASLTQVSASGEVELEITSPDTLGYSEHLSSVAGAIW
jgi:hypothetical protein